MANEQASDDQRRQLAWLLYIGSQHEDRNAPQQDQRPQYPHELHLSHQQDERNGTVASHDPSTTGYAGIDRSWTHPTEGQGNAGWAQQHNRGPGVTMNTSLTPMQRRQTEHDRDQPWHGVGEVARSFTSGERRSGSEGQKSGEYGSTRAEAGSDRG